MNVLHIRAVAAALLTLASAPAWASGFTITTLVSSSQTRPDGGLPWYVVGPPALDGTKAVFMTQNAQVFATYDGIWAIDTGTLVPVKLAGLDTPVPGGSGDFASFSGDGSGLPMSIGGTVLFAGADAAGTFGLFTISANGGTIYNLLAGKVAPDDQTAFTSISAAQCNASTVVFHGITAGGHSGIFAINANGRDLRTVIDNTTNLDARGYGGGENYYGDYNSPVIGQTQIDWYATGIGDPSQYPNEIFAASGASFIGVADNLTPLAGDPAGVGHTQITGYSAARVGNRLAFAARDGSYEGIFLANGYTRTATKLASTATRVPGTADTFSQFYNFSFDTTGLAFVAEDGTAITQSLYFESLTQPLELVASSTVYYFPTVGGHAVDQGRLVFFAGNIFGNAIYLAVPTP